MKATDLYNIPIKDTTYSYPIHPIFTEMLYGPNVYQLTYAIVEEMDENESIK